MHVDLMRACVSSFLDLISFQDLIRDPPPQAFGLSSGVHCLAARVSSIRMQQLPVTICMHTHGADRAYLWIIWWNLCQTAEYEKTTGAKRHTRYVYARSMSIVKVKSKLNKILKFMKNIYEKLFMKNMITISIAYQNFKI